ncbi:DUF6230 family protein [Streptomonospora litoralis]|uniref:Cholesterol esterase n=1 Tax=Streptomonospora litoralis TaxID=2498135 RepID=A0A4P6Q540_9ACTN|nr:DUF6230 family protein [Streptomonospora litoralis]QBI55713.1 hypothetical protein EKD16_19750 [Streptomonospora litoralis]
MAAETQTEAPRASGGTAWKRFALALIPALGAAGILVGLTAQGAVASSFAVSGQSFKVSADQLKGTGFAQFGDVATSGDGTEHPVALSVIDDVELHNLCQSVLMDTAVGKVTLLVKAGQGDQPATAENMVIDLKQLSGDATFTQMQIGRDAATVENASGETGESGAFGQQADTITINGLRQTAWSVNAGTFKLTGLHLSVKPGDHECY